MHLVTSFPMGRAEASSQALWRRCVTFAERELFALLASFSKGKAEAASVCMTFRF